MSKSIEVPEEVMMSKIYIIRGQKVMIDRDLAELYEVETKYLKRQVRRNEKRFPEDFMFQLSKEELEDWRSQFGTSKSDQKCLLYAPYAFTEQGVAMLSAVVNSDRAIEINIKIIRVFVKLRKMVLTNKDLLVKMAAIEKKISGQDKSIKLLFDYLQK